MRERGERRADQVEGRAERGQEQRPDDLVRPLGEGAAGIDHDRRDEQPVAQPGTARVGRRRSTGAPGLDASSAGAALRRSLAAR